MLIEYNKMWKPMFRRSAWHFTESPSIPLLSYVEYRVDHYYINEQTDIRGCLDFIKRKTINKNGR